MRPCVSRKPACEAQIGVHVYMCESMVDVKSGRRGGECGELVWLMAIHYSGSVFDECLMVCREAGA